VHKLEVGQPYHPARTRWPQGTHLRINRNGIDLVLFMDRPKASEVRACKQGPVQWAWVSGEHASVLCYRFGTEPWGDSPYQAHREPQADRGTPPGNAVQIILVDASSGIVRALRLVGWSQEFLDAVLANVADQLARPADERAAEAELNRFYAHDSAVLARDHATARSSGERPAPPEPDTHRNRVNAAQVIAAQSAIVYKAGARYPRPLPPELERWYAYPMDAGHSVFVAIASLIPDGARDGDVSGYLVPAPVRMVERIGWQENPRGFLIADLPYDHTLGLVAAPEDVEY
jgi:hypothetical protein